MQFAWDSPESGARLTQGRLFNSSAPFNATVDSFRTH